METWKAPDAIEQHVVGLHRPVLGVDRGALDQRQQVALDALARDVGTAAVLARADLVDLVEEDDALFSTWRIASATMASLSISFRSPSATSGAWASRTSRRLGLACLPSPLPRGRRC